VATLKLAPEEIAALKRALEEEGFELRPLDHAHYQARGPGVVVSAYRSGKVVVQGKAADRFLETHALGGPGLAEPVAGSDESGKGDYFGPLVVAAVLVAPETEAALLRAGVRDCKTMRDGAILKTAFAVRQLCPHAVRALMPKEYNARHEAEGNVALFLSTMHAEAIAEVLEGHDARRVVIDKFTAESRLRAALHEAGVDLPLEARHRAEDNPAVAAASVLARAEFLLGLKELSNEYGTRLPKGAAHVEGVARSIYAVGGMAALGEVAKVHFKTTQRVVRPS